MRFHSFPRTIWKKVRGLQRLITHRWNMWYGPQRMRWAGGFHNGERIVKYRPPEQGNRKIRELVSDERPIMVARYGQYELRGVAREKYGHQWDLKSAKKRLYLNAGLFPKEEMPLGRFADVYASATRYADVFCACNFRHGFWKCEERVFRENCPDAILTDIGAVKFLKHDNPWTLALKGKTVLVIHPFSNTIEKQYRKNKDNIFPNRKVIPDFKELKTLKAVQSSAGNEVPYDTWFEALDYMKSEMRTIDFDVALIGAGAYGLPLAAYAKELGNQGIHVGGVTQLLFGIMGGRWEDQYRHLVNRYWTRPSTQEVPQQPESVEEGAYW